MNLTNAFFSAIALSAFCAPSLSAEEKPFRFPEGKHAKGALKYVNDVPVLMVQGTPEEMGEQFGTLAVKPIDLDKLLQSVLKTGGLSTLKPLLFSVSRKMYDAFPLDHAKELEAVVKSAKADRDTMIFAQTLADLSAGFGCATIVVDPTRSKTGEALFARNFDWPPAPGLTDHILVSVFKPKGKHAFATITISPVLGCISGMNDAGLAISVNEIHLAKDAEGKQFNPKGTPLLFMFRRVLEECTTVAEAEKLVRSLDRTTCALMTACDPKGGAVFEITTKNVEARRGANAVCCATNHFRTDKLCVSKNCWRFDKLVPCESGTDKLGLEELSKHLHAVNQGKFTIETMIFEPSKRTLHLAYGDGPSSAKPLKKIELGTLFEKGFTE